MNKIILVALAFSVALTGCQGKRQPVITENVVEVDGDTVSVVLNSEDFVELKTNITAENTRKECFKTNQAMPTDPTAQALREMRLATGKVDCGAGTNDAKIAKIEGEVRKKEANNALIGGVLNAAIGGATKVGTIREGAKLVGKVFDKSLDRAGNQVTVDNGSSYQGAQGDGASYTEQISGIRTEPAPVEPIVFGGRDEEEDDVEITNAEQCLEEGGTPVFDAGGNYLRCSDDEGGNL